nr:glycosyltransferase [Kiritimatiellia bacterium]
AQQFSGRPGGIVRTYSRAGGNKQTQGRMTAGNLGFGVAYILRGAGLLLRHRPSVFYLSLPKNFGAFLRSVPLIVMGRAMGSRVCGELAGARFLFLEHPGWKRRIGLWALRRLSSIRFLGASVAAAHAAYGFRRPVVFPNGIDCPASPGDFSQRARRRPMELLYVGALSRSKGIASLIRAVAGCRKAGCRVRLTLVGEWGDSDFQAEVEQIIADLALEDGVCFAGRVTGNAKWEFYRRAALLVHPTEWDGQPLTILEAMAMGVGVIATRVGAIPDTMRDGVHGTLLTDNRPETIASAVQFYIEHPDILEQTMRENRAWYESNYTLEIYLNHTSEWLEPLRT